MRSFESLAQGYIYIQKKTLDETVSIDFPFTVVGTTPGATVVPNFNLNDQDDQIPIQDIGASEGGRLWAVGTNKVLYYRDLSTSAWTASSVTNAERVDGGEANSAYVITSSGSVVYFNGSATTIFSGTNATDIGSAWDNRPYIIANGGRIYRYTGFGSSVAGGTSWPQVGSSTGNLRIDGNPANGNAVYTKQNTIWTITSGGTESSLGSPAGTSTTESAVSEVAVTGDGIIFGTYKVPSLSNNFYAFNWTGTAWSAPEATSREYTNAGMTGGVGEQVWGIYSAGATSTANLNIFTRTVNGTNILWLNDERVRLASASTGNSIMIAVNPGTYTIEELVPTDWHLQSINVYDPSTNSSSSLTGKTATVVVADGETVTALFENWKVAEFVMTTSCTVAYLETFGSSSSTYGAPLTGQTSYHYQTTGNTLANNYKIVGNANLTFSGAASLTDHSAGDGLGKMMTVDANNEKDAFFRRRFTDIIPGATYNFSSWIANINSSAPRKPNVTFEVVDPATGVILQSLSTGNINNTTWKQYGITFEATVAEFDLIIRNNGLGGEGNDLALDDIRFSLAPPTPTIVVENGSCTSGQGSITVTAPLSADYEYSVDGTTWQTTTAFANLATGAYTVYVRFANTTNCTNGVTSAIINPSICGNVFHDANGLNDSQVNGTPINMAGTTPLYVSLYDGATLVSTIPVAADGTYEFVNTTIGTTYTVVLGTNSVANATSPFAGTGTGGWETVGEDCCDNTGGDGATNGSLTITVGASNTNANFGIELQPQSDEHTTTIPQPATNDVLTLNGVGTNPPLLSGSDPEDGTYSGATGTVTNPTGVIITSLPANGVLNYGGTPVTVGQTIADPALLTIVLTGTGYTSVSFNYAYVDAANVDDPTPATYTVSWTGALPVTLVNFEVTKSESQVRISWATSSETNSSYFDVERSTDARTWNVIGKVSANENTDALTEYNFTDATPAQTTNYYRLKMVDQDQSFAYSKIRSVSFEGVNLRMYPNPATSELHIDNVDLNQIQKVVLYATTGNAVYENTGVIKPSINVSRFNSGTYILTITLKNGEKISRTVVKN
ncbi:T9SS type A sorting domain-containing protein [Dyadobacter sp. CY312]|uniref:T9SS type A sorting domain-containing protein n=1 Tax=Dyadobacter sp. CY312 TaxID=2907303 RepID=UPI001F24EC77|nr:T9SS type A sorting domain-containing protein [Dyadobacter sp. CY312]MCE7044689.1 T9SS type A sorting domain-containing protein [Dyadobacter sp. CY312]